MILRRCDSLPARLRENLISKDVNKEQQPEKISDSKTVPNFQESPNKDQVIAAWKSLQTDVKNIKNGFLTANEPTNHLEHKRESIVKNSVANKRVTVYDKNVQRKITYRDVGVNSAGDRSSSYPLDLEQNISKATSLRRKTLLQRLLSWRTAECNCREHYKPKPRPENLLCTCGTTNSNRVNEKDKCIKFSERGRSKSVGYETAREVTQFRRCASAGACVGAENAAALRARAALTLARRYYPEGGWGWTVTIVGTLVQVLTHGLQLGGGPGAIACTAAVRYRVAPLYTHGK